MTEQHADCTEWDGPLNAYGYGRVTNDGELAAEYGMSVPQVHKIINNQARTNV